MNVRNRSMRFLVGCCVVVFCTFVNGAVSDSAEVKNITTHLPSQWNCDITEKTGSIGHPDFIWEGLLKASFSLKTGNVSSPRLELYFYPVDQRDTIFSVIEKSNIFSSMIPCYFGCTNNFIILTVPYTFGNATKQERIQYDSLCTFLNRYLSVYLGFKQAIEFTDRFTLIPDVFSGRANPVFTIKAKSGVDIIKRRLSSYYGKTGLNSKPIEQMSQLGYRSIHLIPAISPELGYQIGRRTIMRQPRPVDSYLWYRHDPQSELERMVIRAAIQENVIDSSGSVRFSDVIPDSLKTAQLKYGISTINLPPDSFALDFSLLDTSGTSKFAPSSTDSTFPDILLKHDPTFSSSQMMFRVRALYSTQKEYLVNLEPFLKPSQEIPDKDSLYTIFRQTWIKADTQKVNYTNAHDTSAGRFFITTTENGRVFFRPVYNYIGGINKIGFFWVYTSSPSFTSPSTGSKIYKKIKSIRAGSNEVYSLQGKKIASETRSRNLNIKINKNGTKKILEALK